MTLDAVTVDLVHVFLLSIGAFVLAMFLTPIYTFFAYRYRFWKRQRSTSTDGKKLEVPVTLDEANASGNAKAGKAAAGKGRLGIQYAPLSAEQLKQLKLEFAIQVQATYGAAAEAGLQAGDLIIGIAGKSIKNDADFRAAIKPGVSLALRVMRGEQVFLLPVDIPADK